MQGPCEQRVYVRVLAQRSERRVTRRACRGQTRVADGPS